MSDLCVKTLRTYLAMLLRAVGNATAEMAVQHAVLLCSPANSTGSWKQKDFLKKKKRFFNFVNFLISLNGHFLLAELDTR
jgi:hypothetical protein